MTKKNHIASSALTAGAMFGLGMGALNGVRFGMGAGIASGLAMGAVFGLAIGLFLRWQHKKAGVLRAEFQAEGVERDGPANVGAAGGWLFLTKQRLVWVPHALNIGAKRIEIPLGDIKSANAKGRKLEILTTAGPRSFLVRTSDEWAAALGSLPTARVVDR